MVYYRTYRPNTINDLDKTDIRKKLFVILSSKSVPHAFLFCGPRGTGKTSTARIVAKILNCTALVRIKDKISVEPCNTCDNCVAISNGTHMDIVEIDAASNRGIDEMRDLRDRVAYAPSMGTNKVYIIDEVHMLTKEAFNALLKTLEEPPLNVTFILATTELQKLPDTIVSRCTQLTFTKATQEEIIRSLKRVAAGEKLKISEHALSLIAQISDGSFRDAVKFLEQGSSENKLDDNGIQTLVGLTSSSTIVTHILKKELSTTLEIIDKEAKSGADFVKYIEMIMNILHDRLLQNPKSVELLRLVRLFSTAYSETKSTSIPQLPLELAVIEYCMDH